MGLAVSQEDVGQEVKVATAAEAEECPANGFALVFAEFVGNGEGESGSSCGAGAGEQPDLQESDGVCFHGWGKSKAAG